MVALWDEDQANYSIIGKFIDIHEEQLAGNLRQQPRIPLTSCTTTGRPGKPLKLKLPPMRAKLCHDPL